MVYTDNNNNNNNLFLLSANNTIIIYDNDWEKYNKIYQYNLDSTNHQMYKYLKKNLKKK